MGELCPCSPVTKPGSSAASAPSPPRLKSWRRPVGAQRRARRRQFEAVPIADPTCGSDVRAQVRKAIFLRSPTAFSFGRVPPSLSRQSADMQVDELTDSLLFCVLLVEATDKLGRPPKRSPFLR